MEALQALHTRVSSPRLVDPAPQGQVLDNIFRAALRAADHGNLRPWRFLVVEGEDRQALGRVFEQAALSDDQNLDETQRERFLKMPLRAPMVVIAIAVCEQHPKVPESEQLIAAGSSVQNMLNAAYAQGVGAYWRTGAMAYHAKVFEGLGLASNEKIVGFVYLGSVEGRDKPLPELKVEDFFAAWPPK